jgi:hypothetical protein
MPRFGYSKALLFSLISLLALAFSVNAQSKTAPPQILFQQRSEQPQQVASKARLYCAGYIRYQPIARTPEIVGGHEEQERRTYSTGDVVYLNAGSKQGIKEGDNFQIIRPRGDVKGVHHQKLGFLGTFVQDIGQLQVFKVHETTSLAQITFSCDSALFGDLVTPVPDRESPVQRAEENLDRYGDPSGKQTGRLMMAKDNREMLTNHDIVYIDLGAEDKVNTGDYLTIFRPLGTGNVTRIHNDEMARVRSDGFESNRYRGGGFSSQASRAKDSSAVEGGNGHYNKRPITSKEVKRLRPQMPRKVVGEMVVIDVQTRTATAIITRIAGEVHTGDWVEIQ